jgi:2-polyprenyl-3-methyl-5-hydroxy-6-metoxy-1,4-benzoquinol methylase
MSKRDLQKDNHETRRAWDQNAAYWDEYMGEGNDFVELLCWPVMDRFLELLPGKWVLDVACGNGLTSRRLALKGYQVVAFDFSERMIATALSRTPPGMKQIQYLVLDATDKSALLNLGEGKFEAAICNMALFDMAQIDPLFQALSLLLKPGAVFIFSVVHPCFNNPATQMVAELEDKNGELVTNYSIKVRRYLTPSVDHVRALRNQPEPQLEFHRALQDLLKPAFNAGFVLDALEERAFPPDHPPGKVPLAWGANFSEIPPVLIARVRTPPR